KLPISILSNGPKMNMQGDPVACAHGMLTVRNDFDMPKVSAEQSSQARAGKKVFVVAFEQMPGNDAPVIKVWQDFHVRDRKKSAGSDYASDFTEKDIRVSDMFEHLDTNRA